ncbi:MAG: Wzz/FepE/Etk N-terminal domain-containing protein [Coriobacteriales bacterium]|nr:Wzz/FepE/Etk N-terminal domain-containing protein [Coriobacteriales bacterium]
MTLFELLSLLKKHLALVIALPVCTAAIVAIGSIFLPNEYTATTTMYVLSKTGEDSQVLLTQSDLSAGQMLTNDVATILRSDRVKHDVAQQFGLESLGGYELSITSSTTTRVITLSVTGHDPKNAAQVANALVEDTSRVASEIMQIEAVNVIDSAKIPTAPSGPRRSLYTAVGFMAGLFAAVAIVVIQDMLDTRIRSGNDVEELVGVPVVGHFPALERS